MATRVSWGTVARLLGGTLVLALVVGILAPVTQAAPFVTVWLEAKVSTEPTIWSRDVLAVNPGQILNYRIYFELATPTGQSNTSAGVSLNNLKPEGQYWANGLSEEDPPTGTLTANGIGGMKFSLYQMASNSSAQTDMLQASFSTVSSLKGGTLQDGNDYTWGDGSGKSGGVVTTRTGTAYKDLKNIRPIAGTGVFVGADADGNPYPVLLTQGNTLALAAQTGNTGRGDSVLRVGIGPYAQTQMTTMKVNGVFVPANTLGPDGQTQPYDRGVSTDIAEQSYYTDPITVYNGITLYTPWREAVLVIPDGGYESDMMDPLTLTAGEGGSHNTTVTYHWLINSGTPIEREFINNPAFTLTPAELNALGAGDHTITLTVTTGDVAGPSTTSAPLTLMPEPATMALLGLGGALVAIRRRRAA